MGVNFSRGSEWRIWDLHIHTPASFEWGGEKYNGDKAHDDKLIDEMIETMNSSDAAVFAIMDYWTFEGWFKLKKRLEEDDAPKLKKVVFPGIELRICAPSELRLNTHVLFSNQIDDQLLRDFMSELKLEITGKSLSDYALREYAKKAGDDKLKHYGTTQSELVNDEEKSLDVGSKIAELDRKSYIEAVKGIPDGLGVAFMPFSTSDGLDEVDCIKHYAFALSLFSLSPIFETRDLDLWAAFSGVETEKNAKWFKNFQAAIKGVPRLAVCGSDAHRFISKKEQRGYAEFPLNKKTWIKSNPSWEGLKQAIKEPEKRSFIGDIPPKISQISNNSTFYIDKLRISRVYDAPRTVDTWFGTSAIDLNTDLIAIIGNKGSGKSALADIIALLGNSQQSGHFSFLKKDRFRGRSGEPAKYFEGELFWKGGDPNKILLSEDPQTEQTEMVRYIPQGRFEALCNDHVSQKNEEFEKELQSVVFAHVPKREKGGSSNFNSLIERLEAGYRKDIADLRASLTVLNSEIFDIECQLHPSNLAKIKDLLKLVDQRMKEHEDIKPKEKVKPTDELTPEQKQANSRILEIDKKVSYIEASIAKIEELESRVSLRIEASQKLQRNVTRLNEDYQKFLADSVDDCRQMSIDISKLAKVETKYTSLIRREAKYRKLIQCYLSDKQKLVTEKNDLNKERLEKSKELAEPQQIYQNYLLELKQWIEALNVIKGSSAEPESKLGLESRISELTKLPDALKHKEISRQEITKKIFELLQHQREVREKLFQPLQAIIKSNKIIREDYQLDFIAKLEAKKLKFSNDLFKLVKTERGPLRGDKSEAAVADIFDESNLETPDDIVALTQAFHKLLRDTANTAEPGAVDIRSVLRKNQTSIEVYDHIFGLEFLEPKYTLKFQETQIEQLSPGQRGSLLLIFYLLVDKGRNPIVLDQPEENLDNQTIVSLLVPVLNEAKKSRQIIMVTHNPNLAVVCDAEQIIHAELVRANDTKINYTSGAIEDSDINKFVVDVLEGTKKAFDNRGNKYH